MDDIIGKLQDNYVCGDRPLHISFCPDEYSLNLKRLWTEPLNREQVDYLCEQIDEPRNKCSVEMRFYHLQPLIINPTSEQFDLKDFFFQHQKKCRRLWLRFFYIRGFAAYASEAELISVMKKFDEYVEKYPCYLDMEDILSVAGLPYLLERYGYDCFRQSLEHARAVYSTKVDPLLRGIVTLDENCNTVALLTDEQTRRRIAEFDKKCEKAR